MKLLILALIIGATQAMHLFNLVNEEWNLYKVQYKKEYKSDIEEKFRMKIFVENRRRIAVHNTRYLKGEVTFKLGINQLSDMLPHEISQSRNGFNRSSVAKSEEKRGAFYIPPANVELPSNVDWRNHGAVTPVKDQGDCGSCWAFSATGSLEGQHSRMTGQLVSLSEQNLIDCSSDFGNGGCDGGGMNNAFVYITYNHGIDTETSYPYEGKDGPCKYQAENRGATDRGYVDIQPYDEYILLSAVATQGPIAVAIDADHESFQSYSEGVYYEPNCGSNPSELNHAVLLIGYDTTDHGLDYWIVKNSWGETWGEEGYIKMARNQNNNCGIASAASFPLV